MPLDFPPQCPICSQYWINEGKPGNFHYYIVAGGGHIPGVHPLPPTPEETRLKAEVKILKGELKNSKAEIGRLQKDNDRLEAELDSCKKNRAKPKGQNTNRTAPYIAVNGAGFSLSGPGQVGSIGTFNNNKP